MAWPELCVVEARLYDVAIPLVTPFRISGGTMSVRRSVIVELRTADGLCGFGEAAPFERPFYSAETTESARGLLTKVLLPRVIGLPMTTPSQLHDRLTVDLRGNPMARAGVETAWWDLVSRDRDVGLASLVSERLAELGVPSAGRHTRTAVESGMAIGIPASERLVDLRRDLSHAVERGYHRVKLKIRPGWDVKPLRVASDVLQASERKLLLWADANGAYDRHTHGTQLHALDALGLLFVEQPFDEADLWDTVRWSRAASTPVCLDESLVSDRVARQVLEMDGPAIWNLKVQRLGGLEETCRVYARAMEAGVKVWTGTMPETGLGVQSSLAIASLAGCVFPTDVEPSERWFAPGTDLVDVRMDRQGRIPVSDRPFTAPPTHAWSPLAVVK